MNNLKINFLDFWSGFNPNNDPVFGKFLNKHYNIIYNTTNPDLIIFSVFGNTHKRYNKNNIIKIFYTPENFISHSYPALDNVKGWGKVKNFSNYSITSFDIKDNTNYRMPSYVRRYGFDIKNRIDNEKEKKIKDKDIVYLQRSCTHNRDEMVKKLMKYFSIDAVGKCLNNKKVNIKNKIEFIKDYNMVIAFENSTTIGYSTEKIIDPFIANSIPIYWGDNNINKDYNEKAFINYHSYSEEEIIDKLSDLLRNKNNILEILNNKKIKNEDIFNESLFLGFFKKCIT